MSEIILTKQAAPINPAAGRKALYLNAAGSLVARDEAGAESAFPTLTEVRGVFSGRNRIINGDMRIDQRNGGASIAAGVSPAFAVDRFFYNLSQSGKFSAQQVVDAPPGFRHSLRTTVSASYTPLATDTLSILQGIEGHNMADVEFGLATGKALMLSFWAKASVAGNYSVGLINNAGPRSFTTLVPVTTVWTRITVPIPPEVSGVWPLDANVWAYFCFDLGSGSNFTAAGGVWNSNTTSRNVAGGVKLVSQANGSTLHFTGVQLEVGAVATPFEPRQIATELALCQRYFAKVGNSVAFSGNVASGSTYYASYTLPVSMRTGPTLTLTNIVASGFPATAGGTSLQPGNSIVNESRIANATASGAVFGSEVLASAEL